MTMLCLVLGTKTTVLVFGTDHVKSKAQTKNIDLTTSCQISCFCFCSQDDGWKLSLELTNAETQS